MNSSALCVRSFFGSGHSKLAYANITLDALHFNNRLVVVHTETFESGTLDIFYKRLLQEEGLVVKDLANFIPGGDESLYEFLCGSKPSLKYCESKEILLIITMIIYSLSVDKNSNNYKLMSTCISMLIMLFHPYHVTTDMENRFIKPIDTNETTENLLANFVHKDTRRLELNMFQGNLFVNLSHQPYIETLSHKEIKEFHNTLYKTTTEMLSYFTYCLYYLHDPLILNRNNIKKNAKTYLKKMPFMICIDHDSVKKYRLKEFDECFHSTGNVMQDLLVDKPAYLIRKAYVLRWWEVIYYKDNVLEQKRYIEATSKMPREVKEYYEAKPCRSFIRDIYQKEQAERNRELRQFCEI